MRPECVLTRHSPQSDRLVCAVTRIHVSQTYAFGFHCQFFGLPLRCLFSIFSQYMLVYILFPFRLSVGISSYNPQYTCLCLFVSATITTIAPSVRISFRRCHPNPPPLPHRPPLPLPLPSLSLSLGALRRIRCQVPRQWMMTTMMSEWWCCTCVPACVSVCVCARVNRSR